MLANRMDLSKFESSVFFSIVRIVLSQGRGESVGTGFLLRASFDSDKEGQGATLLISNKHVFEAPSQNLSLQFHRRNPQSPREPLLGQIVSAFITEFRKNSIYVEHPDQSIDLACVVANAIEDPKFDVFALTIPRVMLATYQEQDLSPGQDVWFVGYPADRYDIANNLPLMRHGYIASIPSVDFGGNKQIIIDAPVFPGSSGSPVSTDINGKIRLIGVIVETMIQFNELKALPTSQVVGIENIIGLGIVLKSTLLDSLIDAALRKVRDR